MKDSARAKTLTNKNAQITHITTMDPMEISLTDVIKLCETEITNEAKNEDAPLVLNSEDKVKNAQKIRMRGLMRQLTMEGRATPGESADTWTITQEEEQKLKESYDKRKLFLGDSINNDEVTLEMLIQDLEGDTFERSKDKGKSNISKLSEREQLAQNKRITEFMKHLMTESDALPQDEDNWWSVKQNVLQNLRERYKAYADEKGLTGEIIKAKELADLSTQPPKKMNQGNFIHLLEPYTIKHSETGIGTHLDDFPLMQQRDRITNFIDHLKDKNLATQIPDAPNEWNLNAVAHAELKQLYDQFAKEKDLKSQIVRANFDCFAKHKPVNFDQYFESWPPQAVHDFLNKREQDLKKIKESDDPAAEAKVIEYQENTDKALEAILNA